MSFSGQDIPQTSDTLVALLNAFEPTDNHLDNTDALYDLIGCAEITDDPSLLAIAALGIFERYPASDFGAPGPLVHFIESLPGYQERLIESLIRRPTDYTVIMTARILNSEITQAQRTYWIDLLHQCVRHPAADDFARSRARTYVDRHAQQP